MRWLRKQIARFGSGNLLLKAELAVIVAGPVLLMSLPFQLLRFSTVFLLAGYCLWRLKHNGVIGAYLQFNWTGCRKALPGVVLRCFLGAIAIIAIVLVVSPERLFCIPRADPMLMVLIVAFYGLVSVLPQEIVFRGYAAWRLDSFNVPFLPALFISALLFGWVHILFGSLLSVVLSMAAGLSFFRTYRKYRSLAAVWLEHSLIGIAIFAFGLDNLFYLGPTPEAFASVCSATVAAR
ncbi:MAG: CPBP family intramembrane metalloprotease [Roseibium sp.]|uniref:CPBP family intramembrane glutamic endopeptidase n=1 Tax=Roseibium sp. TaxID=1936156 RepID=UPI0026399143|nr:CPBP family intramembrane glutamic endopeptidase [Roseibium sp.]MCV0425145.1 CPBP family intramembrane metalloprotease [Roseibium sp.]